MLVKTTAAFKLSKLSQSRRLKIVKGPIHTKKKRTGNRLRSGDG